MSPTRAQRRKLRVLLEEREKKNACGSCTACCTTMSVAVLEKPAYVACKHERREEGAEGCGIYGHRPAACREYACTWKRLAEEGKPFLGLLQVDPALDAEPSAFRPDRCGFVLDLLTKKNDATFLGHDTRVFVAHCDPTRRLWRGNEILSRELRLLGEKFVVILVSGDARKIIGPPAKIDAFLRASGLEARAIPEGEGS